MYQEKDWDIDIDGKKLKEQAFIINVANGRQFGYNFKIAPGASWTDGLFDIVVVRKFPKVLGGFMALRLLRGSITSSAYVQHYHGRTVTIAHPELDLIQLDGDPHSCEGSVTFNLISGLQPVIVP